MALVSKPACSIYFHQELIPLFKLLFCNSLIAILVASGAAKEVSSRYLFIPLYRYLPFQN